MKEQIRKLKHLCVREGRISFLIMNNNIDYFSYCSFVNKQFWRIIIILWYLSHFFFGLKKKESKKLFVNVITKGRERREERFVVFRFSFLFFLSFSHFYLSLFLPSYPPTLSISFFLSPPPFHPLFFLSPHHTCTQRQ